MNAFRIQILVALALLLLSATAFAMPRDFGDTWYVAQKLDTRACYRITHYTPTYGWRAFGPFHTFRKAGAFVWRHRDICQTSPALN